MQTAVEELRLNIECGRGGLKNYQELFHEALQMLQVMVFGIFLWLRPPMYLLMRFM